MLGILLVSLILPLIDALTALILTMIEVAKGYFSVKVTEYNYRLKKLEYSEEYEEKPRKLIGFMRDNEEEIEDNEDL